MKNYFSIFFLVLSLSIYSQQEIASFNEFFYEGRLIKEVEQNNIIISSSLRQVQRSDGKYYTFDISVTNNTNRDVTLLTKQIEAEIFSPNGKKSIVIPALTRKEYLKIKKRRQNFRTGMMALAGGMSAASAGYSSSTTSTNSYGNYSGTANTNASAYGSGGYAYGNATTNYSGNIYGTSTSTTNSYNGADAYAATQNEQAKMNAFLKASQEAKARWNDEYLKNHTMTPKEIISGLINVKFYKSKRIILKITVDNSSYYFDWDPDDSEF